MLAESSQTTAGYGLHLLQRTMSPKKDCNRSFKEKENVSCMYNGRDCDNGKSRAIETLSDGWALVIDRPQGCSSFCGPSSSL